MDLAIVRLNGKQYVVKNDQSLKLDRLSKDAVVEVLLWQEGAKIEVGTPVLKDRSVKIELIEDKLDKKVNVSRFKAKSRYRKHKGHRQAISKIKVTA